MSNNYKMVLGAVLRQIEKNWTPDLPCLTTVARRLGRSKDHVIRGSLTCVHLTFDIFINIHRMRMSVRGDINVLMNNRTLNCLAQRGQRVTSLSHTIQSPSSH